MNARVYLAHPISTYGTDHERRALDTLAKLVPGAEVINPAGRYTGNLEWRRAWPRIVRTLDAVVVLSTDDDTIGCGCLHEITDAILHWLPVNRIGSPPPVPRPQAPPLPGCRRVAVEEAHRGKTA